MLRVVLDTNIIVSALWNPEGVPAEVWRRGLLKEYMITVSQGVLDEYENVLRREKFRHKFSIDKVEKSLCLIQLVADNFVPETSTTPHFTDETDRKFYDLAKAADAYLITGNIKHFPQDNKIITPADFLGMY